MSTVRVAINLTVEIDAENWNMAYGTGVEPAAVRADVRLSVESAVRDHLDREGFLVGIKSR